MNSPRRSTLHGLFSFLLLSLAAHFLILGRVVPHQFQFTHPITALEITTLGLAENVTLPARLPAALSAATGPSILSPSPPPPEPATAANVSPLVTAAAVPSRPVVGSSDDEAADEAAATADGEAESPTIDEEREALPVGAPSATPTKTLQPIRENSEFLSATREKLAYRITLYGIPIGEAVLEASNSDGKLRIISTARSNDFISLVYPVDNRTETDIFFGRYIMTKIRQREGGYDNDIGFTLCLPERISFGWIACRSGM